MKRSLYTTAIFFFLLSVSIDAQGWRNNTDIYFGQSNYHSDNYNNDHYNYDKRSGKRHYTLSRKDKRKLARLQRELKKSRKYAFRDGFLSRRERRRIQSIKEEIGYLLNRNSHVHYTDNSYRRNRNGCR